MGWTQFTSWVLPWDQVTLLCTSLLDPSQPRILTVKLARLPACLKIRWWWENVQDEMGGVLPRNQLTLLCTSLFPRGRISFSSERHRFDNLTTSHGAFNISQFHKIILMFWQMLFNFFCFSWCIQYCTTYVWYFKKYFKKIIGTLRDDDSFNDLILFNVFGLAKLCTLFWCDLLWW